MVMEEIEEKGDATELVVASYKKNSCVNDNFKDEISIVDIAVNNLS